MSTKNALVGVMTVLALALTVGCSRSGGLKAVKPRTDQQKGVDEKNKKTLNGSLWAFDFASQTYSEEKMREMNSLRESEHGDFDTTVSDNGRMVFPRTISFTSDKELVLNPNSGDSCEATYTLENGFITIKPKDAKDSVKEVNNLFVAVETQSSSMVWSSEDPKSKSKSVYVFKRVK